MAYLEKMFGLKSKKTLFYVYCVMCIYNNYSAKKHQKNLFIVKKNDDNNNREFSVKNNKIFETKIFNSPIQLNTNTASQLILKNNKNGLKMNKNLITNEIKIHLTAKKNKFKKIERQNTKLLQSLIDKKVHVLTKFRDCIKNNLNSLIERNKIFTETEKKISDYSGFNFKNLRFNTNWLLNKDKIRDVFSLSIEDFLKGENGIYEKNPTKIRFIFEKLIEKTKGKYKNIGKINSFLKTNTYKVYSNFAETELNGIDEPFDIKNIKIKKGYKPVIEKNSIQTSTKNRKETNINKFKKNRTEKNKKDLNSDNGNKENSNTKRKITTVRFKKRQKNNKFTTIRCTRCDSANLRKRIRAIYQHFVVEFLNTKIKKIIDNKMLYRTLKLKLKSKLTSKLDFSLKYVLDQRRQINCTNIIDYLKKDIVTTLTEEPTSFKYDSSKPHTGYETKYKNNLKNNTTVIKILEGMNEFQEVNDLLKLTNKEFYGKYFIDKEYESCNKYAYKNFIEKIKKEETRNKRNDNEKYIKNIEKIAKDFFKLENYTKKKRRGIVDIELNKSKSEDNYDDSELDDENCAIENEEENSDNNELYDENYELSDNSELDDENYELSDNSELDDENYEEEEDYEGEDDKSKSEEIFDTNKNKTEEKNNKKCNKTCTKKNEDEDEDNLKDNTNTIFNINSIKEGKDIKKFSSNLFINSVDSIKVEGNVYNSDIPNTFSSVKNNINNTNTFNKEYLEKLLVNYFFLQDYFKILNCLNDLLIKTNVNFLNNGSYKKGINNNINTLFNNNIIPNLFGNIKIPTLFNDDKTHNLFNNGTLPNLFNNGTLPNLFNNGTLPNLFNNGNGTLPNLFDNNLLFHSFLNNNNLYNSLIVEDSINYNDSKKYGNFSNVNFNFRGTFKLNNDSKYRVVGIPGDGNCLITSILAYLNPEETSKNIELIKFGDNSEDKDIFVAKNKLITTVRRFKLEMLEFINEKRRNNEIEFINNDNKNLNDLVDSLLKSNDFLNYDLLRFVSWKFKINIYLCLVNKNNNKLVYFKFSEGKNFEYIDESKFDNEKGCKILLNYEIKNDGITQINNGHYELLIK